jgi:hypothetical protein
MGLFSFCLSFQKEPKGSMVKHASILRSETHRGFFVGGVPNVPKIWGIQTENKRIPPPQNPSEKN